MSRFSMKQWRLLREMSQEDMANACNVHRNTIAKWEEDNSQISIANARTIADALKVSLDDIIFAVDSTKCIVLQEEE